MPIGLLGAFPQEVEYIKKALTDVEAQTIGGRTFLQGKLNNNTVVLAFSKWGKVSAATTATTLINKYNVNKIIFSGVAGSLDKKLSIGDIVVGDKCIQHDMNAQPLFPKFEVPLIGKAYFNSCNNLVTKACLAALNFVEIDLKKHLCQTLIKKFNLQKPKVHVGTIVTGDEFIACADKVKNLKAEINNALAVEMEGAAIAQVCNDYNIPFVVLRVMSDKADSTADMDFENFSNHVCPVYTFGIVSRLVKSL